MSLTLGAALGLGAGSALVNLGGSFLGSLFNKGAAEAALDKQVQASKDLLDYQMQKYSSPLAQMKQIGKAGLNPAAMFGNTAPVNVGGSMAMPYAPTYGLDVGTHSLSDVASLLVGAAQAKKAGADTKVAENAAEGAALDNERKTMENDFMKRYGLQKSAAELALAEQNVKLAQATTNVQQQEKALKEWQSAKEKALSECSEKQRDLLQKELDNKDTEIRLRNEKAQEEIKTEKSAQSANYASAENQRSQASLNASQEKINGFIADIKEIERNFNTATFDTRFKQELGKLSAMELSSLIQSIHAKDLESYNAFQRILLGKTQKGDVKKVFDVLHDIDKTTALQNAVPR